VKCFDAVMRDFVGLVFHDLDFLDAHRDVAPVRDGSKLPAGFHGEQNVVFEMIEETMLLGEKMFQHGVFRSSYDELLANFRMV
jgi:hypothetical protein